MKKDKKTQLNPTGVSEILLIFLVTVLFNYIIVRENYSKYPTPSSKQTVVLLIVSFFVILLGFFVQRMRKNNRVGVGSNHYLNPILISRFALIGKVSCWSACIMVGIAFSYGVYIFVNDKYYDFWDENMGVLLNFLCSVILLVSGLWLEYCCKLPKDQLGDNSTLGNVS